MGPLPERSTFAKPIAPRRYFDNDEINWRQGDVYDGFSQMLTNLLRDKNVASRLVPIIPDEARTFGMEGF